MRHFEMVLAGGMAVTSFSTFLNNLDVYSLISFLINGVAILVCLTIHELSHGATAYYLGDPTAKEAGRLTLNPIKHIDVFGLLMMVVARVGWAKAVPVDMRNFKRPKRDMAITALAGPGSNFLVALAALKLLSLTYHGFLLLGAVTERPAVFYIMLYVMQFLAYLAILSVGLGIFNLIPIPPLDGSKVLFSVLPQNIYYIILRYERYIMGAVLLLAFSGVLSSPLSQVIGKIIQGMCVLTGCPAWLVLG